MGRCGGRENKGVLGREEIGRRQIRREFQEGAQLEDFSVKLQRHCMDFLFPRVLVFCLPCAVIQLTVAFGNFRVCAGI